MLLLVKAILGERKPEHAKLTISNAENLTLVGTNANSEAETGIEAALQPESLVCGQVKGQQAGCWVEVRSSGGCQDQVLDNHRGCAGGIKLNLSSLIKF